MECGISQKSLDFEGSEALSLLKYIYKFRYCASLSFEKVIYNKNTYRRKVKHHKLTHKELRPDSVK